MSNVDFEEAKKEIMKSYRGDRDVLLSLQASSVYEYRFSRTDLPVLKHILTSEAEDLLKITEPATISIKYADTVDVAHWWNLMKDSFPRHLENHKDLKEIDFLLINLGIKGKPDLGKLPTVLSEVIGKMTVMKPDVFHIYCSETSFKFTSIYPRNDSEFKDTRSFSINLLGKYSMVTSFAELFSTILQPHLPNIKKLYIVCNFPCLTCTERLFEGLKWPLPLKSKDTKSFWCSPEGKRLESHDYGLYLETYPWSKLHKFMISSTGTEAICFYGSMKYLDPKKFCVC